MSQWRYEVTKQNCKIWDKNPEYAQFSVDSIKEAFTGIGEGGTIYFKYASEIPRKVVTAEFKFMLAPNTVGNGKLDSDVIISNCYPARRLGRMFPRHKKSQRIIYKEAV